MSLKIKKPVFLTAAISLAVIIIGVGTAFATSAIDASKEEKLAKPPLIAESFSGLTAEQKAEIYKITDEIQSSQTKLLDKLVEFGAIDKDAAEEMKTRDAERYEQAKKDGNLPFKGRMGENGKGKMGGRAGRGGRFNGDIKPNETCTETCPETATN